MALPINVFRSVTKKLTDTLDIIYTSPINNTAIILMAQVANVEDIRNKLTVTQNEIDFDGAGDNGTFLPGKNYSASDVIILNNGDSITVGNITADLALQEGQDHSDFDNTGNKGTFAVGSGYAINNIITLSNNDQIRVDTVGGGGEVTTFTVLVVDGVAVAGTPLTQDVVDPPNGGTGFTLTPQSDNLAIAGRIGEFTVTDVVGLAVSGVELTQNSVSPIGGTGFSLTPDSGNLQDVAPETHEVTFELVENPAGTVTRLVKDFSIPPNDAATLVTGKLIVAAGNQLRARASQNEKLELILSILESRNA
jgi:hypothetical protein